MSNTHVPVLHDEIMHALCTDKDGIYLDATFGRGGHTRGLLECLGHNARVFALDQDPTAAKVAATEFDDPRFQFVSASFKDIAALCHTQGIFGKLSGILLDLGVSSPQLDNPERGFSFLHDGPLDMRMNPNTGQSAAQWLSQVAEKDLVRVLFEFGEERYARSIARHIVNTREHTPILRTRQLAELVAELTPAYKRERHKHPATRTFQAIRIHINDELNALKACLDAIPGLLQTQGRMAVISFHSLEDRMVKRFIHAQEQGISIPRHLPVTGDARHSILQRVGKAIFPGSVEIQNNPRARSAVLRVAKRV